MEFETEDLPIETLAYEAMARSVASTCMGHDIERVHLGVDVEGRRGCAIERADDSFIPVWDGTVMDVCAKQANDGCQPKDGCEVPDECGRCMAQIALRQTHVPDTRAVAQDLCRDAFDIVTQYGDVIDALVRQLMRTEEVTGQEILAAMAPVRAKISGGTRADRPG